MTEAEESQIIEAEIKKRRQRLGGQTMSAIETRKAVQAELMENSQLVMLYKTILDDPDASEKEELRRDIEHRLLLHLRSYLESLPSSFDPPTLDLKAIPKRREILAIEELEKGRVRGEVEELSRGLVIIRSVEESAWLVYLEWSDEFASSENMNWIDLEAYYKLFPQ